MTDVVLLRIFKLNNGFRSRLDSHAKYFLVLVSFKELNVLINHILVQRILRRAQDVCFLLVKAGQFERVDHELRENLS